MAQETAVEWLKNTLECNYGNPDMLFISWKSFNDLFEQAKQMEKEQMINAYNQDLYGGLTGDKKFDDGEQYYNETYKNQ